MQIPRLHPDTIEEIKQKVDIVEVISDHVVLNKRGKDLVGLCPFHQEKTGSFTVSPSQQMYYCFGCAAGGNGIKFLMEIGKQSFQEVVLDLAKRYQVPIKTLERQSSLEVNRQLSLRENMYEILAVSTSFYQYILQQEQGKVPLEYLEKERQLSLETVQSFQLGYAPGGWETLYKYLIESKRYPVTVVEQAGLIKPRKSGSGYYDLFRDRLMIPIKDTQGRVIAFGSRSLNGEEPKYLNSPETPLFDKSKILFALDRAKMGISKQDQAIVVEGYFDAIALHSVGITNAVASLGTAFSSEQLKQLLRYSESKQVIFNFDADKAGLAATQRAIKEIEPLIYAGQVQAKILHLPQGKDADEFLKSSPHAVEDYLESAEQAPLWMDWQIAQLINNKRLDQADHFQQISSEMIQYISKLASADLRTYYIEKCATILSNGEVRLISSYVQNLQNKLKRLNSPSATASPSLIPLVNGDKSLLEKAESFLLLIYLHCSDYRQKIRDSLEDKEMVFTLSPHRSLWQVIMQIQASDNEPNLLELLQDYYFNEAEKFKQVSHLFHLSEKNHEDLFRISELIEQAIASLERVQLEKYRQLCLQKWQELSQNENNNSYYYLQEFYNTQAKIHQLDQVRLTAG